MSGVDWYTLLSTGMSRAVKRGGVKCECPLEPKRRVFWVPGHGYAHWQKPILGSYDVGPTWSQVCLSWKSWRSIAAACICALNMLLAFCWFGKDMGTLEFARNKLREPTQWPRASMSEELGRCKRTGGLPRCGSWKMSWQTLSGLAECFFPVPPAATWVLQSGDC